MGSVSSDLVASRVPYLRLTLSQSWKTFKIDFLCFKTRKKSKALRSNCSKQPLMNSYSTMSASRVKSVCLVRQCKLLNVMSYSSVLRGRQDSISLSRSWLTNLIASARSSSRWKPSVRRKRRATAKRWWKWSSCSNRRRKRWKNSGAKYATKMLVPRIRTRCFCYRLENSKSSWALQECEKKTTLGRWPSCRKLLTSRMTKTRPCSTNWLIKTISSRNSLS